MSKANRESHPYIVLEKIKPQLPSNAIATFSKYTYHPQTIKDDRTLIEIPLQEITWEKVCDLIESLESDQELAFHSNLSINSEIRHIPMVDFATSGKAQVSKLIDYIGKGLMENFLWFNSGRSFHGYGTTLISQKEWYELMGKLLLANQPSLPPLTDPRWVGHRLIAGYAALRWSKNTDSYKQEPTLFHSF